MVASCISLSCRCNDGSFIAVADALMLGVPALALLLSWPKAIT
jgi:hypothetical protein